MSNYERQGIRHAAVCATPITLSFLLDCTMQWRHAWMREYVRTVHAVLPRAPRTPLPKRQRALPPMAAAAPTPPLVLGEGAMTLRVCGIAADGGSGFCEVRVASLDITVGAFQRTLHAALGLGPYVRVDVVAPTPTSRDDTLASCGLTGLGLCSR